MKQTDFIKNTMVMPTGRTICKTEKAAGETLSKLYRETWDKGIAIPYQDERCKNDNEFILANPDGSEDLAVLDTEAMENIIIRKIAEPGKGKYAHLVLRNNVS